jgi:hypothetical protein
MSLDEFTTDALALLAAAGKADFELETEMLRKRSGEKVCWLTVYDPSASRNPFDCHAAKVFGAAAETALARLATALGLTYPLPATVFATQQQKEDLRRLYNSPHCKRWEKTKMLLNLDHYTQAQAAEMLADGPLSFRQELRRREAAERGVDVVAEVFTVQAAA